MKKLITMMMIASVPVMGVAQSKIGIDLNSIDKTVKPSENFYQYAVGNWMKNNPLPAAYSRYGSFDKLQEDNNKRINDILNGLLKKKYANGTVEQKLGDFYKLAMDSVRRNKEGVAPVKPLLAEIESAKNKADVQNLQMKYALFGYGVPMGVGFGADEKNASMNILNINQGGLTLGLKEYYLDNDATTTEIRNAFSKHIARMFKIYGFSAEQAEAKRDAILRFETAVALISKSRTELRDVEANYNKMTMSQFSSNYPDIPLEKFMNAQGVNSNCIQELVVGQPNFCAGLDRLLATATADDLKAIMEWDVIMSSAGYLSDEVEAANFDFFGKTMRGRQCDFPLWKRATLQTESQMGEVLGRIFCEKYFPASSKTRMEQLVKNLQVSLGERINAQSWMSETTKKAALDKLSAFYVKIGYPDNWKDLSALNIDPSKSYYENVLACRLFWSKKELDEHAGKPVDKDEWYMTPQTVNAYYNPTTNEICFPAGILQPPFFDAKADDAFIYGAIGVVIGHEMTHGFDDQGRHYDKNGNMVDWWKESDAKMFDERAQRCVKFFNNIKVLPDLNANGELTLGENLADHGGLMVSYNAFKNATKGKKLKTVDGLTPDQRFFLAYSGVWASNITEKEMRNRTKSDPHSLGEWRVNGTLPHINAWNEAFGIKKGDKLFVPQDQRIDIW